MKKKLLFGLPDGNIVCGDTTAYSLIEKFPYAGNFFSYKEYEKAALEWKKEVQLNQMTFLFPLPMSIAYSKCPEPVIESEVLKQFGYALGAKAAYAKMLDTHLCPENQLELENIIINQKEFDKKTDFPVGLSKAKPIKVSRFLNKSAPILNRLAPHQPIPSCYDTYEEYLAQMKEWSRDLPDLYDIYAFSVFEPIIEEKPTNRRTSILKMQKRELFELDQLETPIQFHRLPDITAQSQEQNKPGQRNTSVDENFFSNTKVEDHETMGGLVKSLYKIYKETLLTETFNYQIPRLQETAILLSEEDTKVAQSFTENMIKYGEIPDLDLTQPTSVQNLTKFQVIKRYNALQRENETFKPLTSYNLDIEDFLTLDIDFFTDYSEGLPEFISGINSLASQQIVRLQKRIYSFINSAPVEKNLLWAKIYIFTHKFLKDHYQSFGTSGDVLNISYTTANLLLTFSTTNENRILSDPSPIADDDSAFLQFQNSAQNVRYLQEIYDHFSHLGPGYEKCTHYFDQFLKQFFSIFEDCLEYMRDMIYAYLSKAKKTKKMAIFLIDLMKINSSKIPIFIQNIPNSIFSFFEDESILKEFRSLLLIDPTISSHLLTCLSRMPKIFIPQFTANSNDTMRDFIAEIFKLSHPIPQDLKSSFVTDFLYTITKKYANKEKAPHSLIHLMSAVSKLFILCLKSPTLQKRFSAFIERNVQFFFSIITQKDCMLSISLEILGSLLPIGIKQGSLKNDTISSAIGPVTLHMCCTEPNVSIPAWRCMRQLLSSEPSIIAQIDKNNEIRSNIILAFSGLQEENYQNFMRIIIAYGSMADSNDTKKLLSTPPWKIFAKLVATSQFDLELFKKQTKDIEIFFKSRKFSQIRNNMISIFNNSAFYSACQPSRSK